MLRVVRLVLLGSLLVACGGGTATPIDGGPADAAIDAGPSAACIEAESHSDFTWIQDNIFVKQCTFSGCHNGAVGDAGKFDLRAGKAYASLVGNTSHLCPQTADVTAGHPEQSYLMVMLGQMQPADQSPPSCAVKTSVGLMPQGNPTTLLCSQKRDAIQRWIMAGALQD